jgi:hypothetical protein
LGYGWLVHSPRSSPQLYAEWVCPHEKDIPLDQMKYEYFTQLRRNHHYDDHLIKILNLIGAPENTHLYPHKKSLNPEGPRDK